MPKSWSTAVAVLLFGSSVLFAEVVDKLGPTLSENASAVIGKVSRQRNCLTKITASTAEQNGALMVLDSGTTIYSVVLASGTPFADSWTSSDPLCTSFGSTTTIKVTAGTAYQINYKGLRITH